MVQCYWIEPIDKTRLSLRRFAWGGSCPGGYHNASIPIDIVPYTDQASGDIWPHEDQRWPVTCTCGYQFSDMDMYQANYERIYIRRDTGEEMVRKDFPVGAMYDAYWMPDEWKGADGKSLTVRIPGNHDWNIDSKASNCTLPDDKIHRCWCRHGEIPMITVDKNGNTCMAGAGSILTPSWHGFLRDGNLVEC